MRLPRRLLDAYNAAIKKNGDGAEAAAIKAVNTWLSEKPDASIAETRDYCIALMQELGTSYGLGCGDAAYAMRDVIAQYAGVDLPGALYSYEPDPEYVAKTAKYQVEKLKNGDVDGFVKSIGDASRYFAERGANDTMANLGKADARKLGNRVRFARVPTGATTCPYCLMLASRGFVYRLELMALNANHRHCDCRIVEGFDGMEVEGYDPDEYYDMWEHLAKYNAGELDTNKLECAIELMTGLNNYPERASRIHKIYEYSTYWIFEYWDSDLNPTVPGSIICYDRLDKGGIVPLAIDDYSELPNFAEAIRTFKLS